MAGRGQAIVEDPFQRRLRSKRLHEFRKYLTDVFGIVRNVRIEKRLDDDLQRETRHVACEVTPFAAFPLCNRALGILNHHIAVRADALPVKRGLGQAPLPPPEVAFARYQSIANQTMEERRAQ